MRTNSRSASRNVAGRRCFFSKSRNASSAKLIHIPAALKSEAGDGMPGGATKDDTPPYLITLRHRYLQGTNDKLSPSQFERQD